VMAIMGSTYTGQFDDVHQMNDALMALEREKGWSIPLHIDAASGGLIAPFVWPQLLWDFRLEKVVSINVSGHKFGYVVVGIGWVVWKDEKFLPKDLKFELHYLGGTEESFNLNFSRPACHVIAQYYNFIRLGKEGYRNIGRNCLRNARLLAECLEATGYFDIHSELTNPSLPVVSFSPRNDRIDPYVVSARLRSLGWIVPAYSLPLNCQKVNILRIVIRENFSEDVVDLLLRDVVHVAENLIDERTKLEETIRAEVERALRERDQSPQTQQQPVDKKKESTIPEAVEEEGISTISKDHDRKETEQKHRATASREPIGQQPQEKAKTFARVC